MNRILALDIGTKRIGVAISDPLGYFARGLKVVRRLPEETSVEEIKSLCDVNNVGKIIVGLPLNMKGESGKQVEDVQEYTEKLKEIMTAQFIFQDERLTSVLAEKILIEQDISPSKNKQLIDIKAAELILQQYLDSNANGKVL